jgi:hypothetical protein
LLARVCPRNTGSAPRRVTTFRNNCDRPKSPRRLRPRLKSLSGLESKRCTQSLQEALANDEIDLIWGECAEAGVPLGELNPSFPALRRRFITEAGTGRKLLLKNAASSVEAWASSVQQSGFEADLGSGKNSRWRIALPWKR